MPDFQLQVRDPAGATFASTLFARGAIVTTADDITLLRALGEVGHKCDVIRTIAPGGQVPLAEARAAVLKSILPAEATFGGVVAQDHLNLVGADPNAFVLSLASVAAPVTLDGVALDGVIGGSVFNPPRTVTESTAGATAADAPATATINGEDVDGNVLQEILTLAQTAATVETTKAFAKITSIVMPAADGTGALLEFGFGDGTGLKVKPKVRVGGVSILNENVNGAVPATAGVFATPTAAPPNGTYLPNSVPDGANDYSLLYEKE